MKVATIVRQRSNFSDRRQFFAGWLSDLKALPTFTGTPVTAERNDLARLISGWLDAGVQRGAMRTGIDIRLAAESLLGMMRGINRYGRDYTSPDRAVDIVTSTFLTDAPRASIARIHDWKRPTCRH